MSESAGLLVALIIIGLAVLVFFLIAIFVGNKFTAYEEMQL